MCQEEKIMVLGGEESAGKSGRKKMKVGITCENVRSSGKKVHIAEQEDSNWGSLSTKRR